MTGLTGITRIIRPRSSEKRHREVNDARIVSVDPFSFKSIVEVSIVNGYPESKEAGYSVMDEISGEEIEITESPRGLNGGFFYIRETQEKVYLDPVENEDILENHPELLV